MKPEIPGFGFIDLANDFDVNLVIHIISSLVNDDGTTTVLGQVTNDDGIVWLRENGVETPRVKITL